MLGWHWTGRDVRLALDVEMRKGSRTDNSGITVG